MGSWSSNAATAFRSAGANRFSSSDVSDDTKRISMRLPLGLVGLIRRHVSPDPLTVLQLPYPDARCRTLGFPCIFVRLPICVAGTREQILRAGGLQGLSLLSVRGS